MNTDSDAAERQRELQRQRYRANPAREQARVQAWRRKNRLHIIRYGQVKSCKRRAEAYGLIEHFTLEEWLWKLSIYDGRCHYCIREIADTEVQTDHMTPLSRGGDNTIRNVVPCCKSCNLRKKNKRLDDWMHEVCLLRDRTTLQAIKPASS